MGMDIMNRDFSCNWSCWEGLFVVGTAFDWIPAGTLAPAGFEGEWDGGYFSNGLQVVTAEDAAAWARALRTALAAARGEIEMTADQRQLMGTDTVSWLKRMEEFAGIATAGELVLG